MKIVRRIGPPAGLRRFVYRTPIYVYRAGFGWAFGGRLLLLRHTGRVSGKTRFAVLEVVRHDVDTNCFIVASGWGSTAAWYRNALAAPDVTIQVGSRTMAVTALPLTKQEGADVFTDYAGRHPRTARRVLPRLLGYSVDGTLDDFRQVGLRVPFVRFVPRLDHSAT